MLHPQDTHSLSELKTDFIAKGLKVDFILGSVKCFKLSVANKCFEGLKVKGYSLSSLFTCLLTLPFLGKKSIHNLVQHPIESIFTARKDCFYRMKNSERIHWRNVLYCFVKQFLKITNDVNKTKVDTKSPKCLIIDDSTLSKTGRRIELISRVWDHVTKRFVLGFKVLAALYYDGTSCLPVDFSMHREKGKNKKMPFGMKKKELKKMYRKSRVRNSQGHKRAKEADESKINMALKMIRRAVSSKLSIDYILIDSWFTSWAFISLLIELNKKASSPIHLIGMYKCAKTKFDWNNQSLTHAQIREKLGKTKRCRKLGYYYKQVTVKWKGESIKLFFSREGKRAKWKVFLTTNTDLSFIEMVKIYQIRWAIEVFFKEAKQSLGLGKCQSNDFDAQIADTTLIMIQYMILTLRWRFEQYESKGALFEQDRTKVVAFKLADRLWGLLLQLVKLIETLFEGVDSQEVIAKMFYDKKAQLLIEKFWQDPLEDDLAA